VLRLVVLCRFTPFGYPIDGVNRLSDAEQHAGRRWQGGEEEVTGRKKGDRNRKWVVKGICDSKPSERGPARRRQL